MDNDAFTWLLIKKVVTSELAITVFYKDVANAGKFYKTKWGMSEKTHARLLLIPGGMVEWLSLKLKPRTEYHTKLVELLEVESPDKRPTPSLVGYVADVLAVRRPEELNFLSLVWYRVASHIRRDADKSIFELPLKPLTKDTEALIQWLKDLIIATFSCSFNPLLHQQAIIGPNSCFS